MIFLDNMANSFETLPNEILLQIISNLSWSEILTLFCALLSMNNTRGNVGIVFNRPGLSYEKCSSLLLPIITNSLSLSSAIRCIHINEANSNSSELLHQWFFSDVKQIFLFSNLRSLTLTRCLLSEPLIKTLSMLIELQLDELRLTFDKHMFIS